MSNFIVGSRVSYTCLWDGTTRIGTIIGEPKHLWVLRTRFLTVLWDTGSTSDVNREFLRLFPKEVEAV